MHNINLDLMITQNPEWIWGAIVATPEVADPFAALQGYLGRNAISSNVRACPKAINISLFNSFPATDVGNSDYRCNR